MSRCVRGGGTGEVSSSAQIATWGGFADYDVSGEVLPPFDKAVVAYIHNESPQSPVQVSYKLVRCPASGPPVVGAWNHCTIVPQVVGRVCVSNSGGDAGTWLVGWKQSNFGGSGRDIVGSMVKYTGGSAYPQTLIDNTSWDDDSAVSGNGNDFAVACTDYEGLHVRSFYVSSSGANLRPWSPLTTLQSGNFSGRCVELERVGGYYVAAWQRTTPVPGPDISRIEGCKLWVSSCSPAEWVYTMSQKTNGESSSSWRLFGETSATPSSATPRSGMLIDSTRVGGQPHSVYVSVIGT